ncbi:MarR family transcriptional regulator [Clostridium sp. MSJ-8]|uniref:MarR family winged helix-turn-helix transcriptional regulator n=1 Tax=Clostridium sp. MSJ-8 TaxID=2841510 RepID=UPI001C0E934A|nr:MarR family transcriptional regulator [Clostridium sp. MSJ-8]MBU5488835.1 MarR family transcriptional regulator [Clostridium sp. MSJ-8]
MTEENLGEELYNLLAELLNRKINRTVQDSIRGEYGVLRYLAYVKNNESAGALTEQLHVVPGRMTDILKSLEAKGMIRRFRDENDLRRVIVSITDNGRIEAEEKRKYIRNEYQGLFKILGQDDTKELIRLLKVVLSYSGDISLQ